MPKSSSAKSNSRTATASLFKRLGLKDVNPGVFCGEWLGSGKTAKSFSPIDGKPLATVKEATPADYEKTISCALVAFQKWQTVPAPRRGEIIRQLGNALRAAKQDLGRLVTLEAGKIPAEGEGEVQEMIDICDFAVGLSRQLYGLTIASERPQHRMLEQWHPLGVGWRHHLLQFSDCGLGLEQRAGRRLRKLRPLETLRLHAIDGHRYHEDCRTRLPRQ